MSRARLAVAAALCVAAGCRSTDSIPTAPSPTATPAIAAVANPTHPPHLHTATLADPKTFNPIIATDAASLAALSEVFDALVRLDPRTAEMEPALAERWEANGDGTALTFHLRRDVHWHDGEPFTADDVVFTFDERVANPFRDPLTVDGQRVRVEALDPYTVRLRTPRPFAPLLSAVAVPIVPKHVLGSALAAGDLSQQWGVDTPPAKVIGTGAYRLDRFVAGQLIHLTRNPDFWMRDDDDRQLPYLSEQTIRIVADQQTAYRAFLAGEIDIHVPRPEEVAELEAEAGAHDFSVREVGLDAGMLFVTFNRNPLHYKQNGKPDPRLAWFTDPHFLRAVAHAIDKPALIGTTLHGQGRAAVSCLSPADARFFDPALTDYAYDLEAARRELAEGGYREVDGALTDHDGRPVEFTLFTNSGNPVREQICAQLAAGWAAGLHATVRCQPLDFALLVEKLDTTFDWDAVLTGFTGSPEPHNASTLLRSDGNLHLWYPNQKTPATPWEAEIDRLVDVGSRPFDVEQRRQAYWRVQEILNEQLPIIPIVHTVRFTAATNALQNYLPSVWGVYHPERIRFAQ